MTRRRSSRERARLVLPRLARPLRPAAGADPGARGAGEGGGQEDTVVTLIDVILLLLVGWVMYEAWYRRRG